MIYVIITTSIFFLELILKNFVEKKGKTGVTKTVLSGKLLVRKCHNKGVMLNIGQTKQKLVAGISLGLCVLVTAAAIICGKDFGKLQRIGLSLLLGGGYSNTYDRIFRKYVVDYISFGVKNKWLRQVVFNLADFCIMAGAILIVAGGLKDDDISKR